jgi:hypothetical protein
MPSFVPFIWRLLAKEAEIAHSRARGVRRTLLTQVAPSRVLTEGITREGRRKTRNIATGKEAGTDTCTAKRL